MLASSTSAHAKADRGENAQPITRQLIAKQRVLDAAVTDVKGAMQAGWTGAVTNLPPLRETAPASCAAIEGLARDPLSGDAT